LGQLSHLLDLILQSSRYWPPESCGLRIPAGGTKQQIRRPSGGAAARQKHQGCTRWNFTGQRPQWNDKSLRIRQSKYQRQMNCGAVMQEITDIRITLKMLGSVRALPSKQRKDIGELSHATSILIGVLRAKPYNLLVRQLTLPIVIESDADGYYVSCPALQGCYSQGDTYEQAVANIQDAIRLHIDDRIADGEEIPEYVSVSLSTVEVSM
jgi:predicted RNase H-like HicB family nuclease